MSRAMQFGIITVVGLIVWISGILSHDSVLQAGGLIVWAIGITRSPSREEP